MTAIFFCRPLLWASCRPGSRSLGPRIPRKPTGETAGTLSGRPGRPRGITGFPGTISPSDSTRPVTEPFRSPRLMAATHHLCGSLTLPPRPSAHADPTTPAREDGLFGRLLPHPPTAFPLWQEGRLQRETTEACSGFTFFRPALLHLGCAEDFPRGFSRTIARARLLQ
jgi:hypothetical protein